ncbi:helix-turn-helix domain-containing protein [Congregibacter litoralis]|uniref:Transcriptional regulator, AraC family n=1 Tax=Congregibacter litoralis KT71 TaxID=314285 RepID=A4A9T6_9GAMM|nr:helix-turn-helix domain-containing protein [Congregibacter litoralis]EAQ97253.1 transcriptional regulator, AraC family [Congregibacter litoralis KT71]
MPDLLIAAIGFSLSQVLLGLLLLLRQASWGTSEKLFALFMVAIIGYLLSPVLSNTPFTLLASTVQTAAPGVFWLLSLSIFDDRFRLRAWQLSLVKFTVFMPLLGALLSVNEWRWLFMDLPQFLEFVILALTLWVIVRHWRTDLVETRRRLRLWFVGVNGSYLFILILSREVLFPGAPWLYVLEYLPPAALLLAVNGALLQYRPGVLFTTQVAQTVLTEAATATEPPVDGELAARLQAFMEDNRAWREMGLSIGGLAQKLEVPEYRLRRTINGALGYRNFSDFLNSYRIRETASRLSNSGEDHLPVLTIAMDAGFRSLSSFNKAFREIQGQTPTAWRKAHRQNSQELS